MDYISNVSIGALSNASEIIYYIGDYTALGLTIPNLVQGISNTISITATPSLEYGFSAVKSVWIDYNHYNDFQMTGEVVSTLDHSANRPYHS